MVFMYTGFVIPSKIGITLSPVIAEWRFEMGQKKRKADEKPKKEQDKKGKKKKKSPGRQVK